MTFAIRIGGAWTALPYGQSVTNEAGIRASYDTLMLWTDDEREAFGVFAVPEPGDPPKGKVETGRTLGGHDRPEWGVAYGDIKPLQVSAVTPAQAKVALFNRGLLDQVKAIIDAQDYEPIKIFYDDATMWEKSNPYLQAIAVQLGLVIYDASGNEDATELDKVFSEASKL